MIALPAIPPPCALAIDCDEFSRRVEVPEDRARAVSVGSKVSSIEPAKANARKTNGALATPTHGVLLGQSLETPHSTDDLPWTHPTRKRPSSGEGTTPAKMWCIGPNAGGKQPARIHHHAEVKASAVMDQDSE